MSFEHTEEFANVTEEVPIFEEMSYTRNIGAIKENDILPILKDNQEFWRLPTVAELYALKKQNKSNFFKQKSYWAGDSSSEVREVRLGNFLKPVWFYSKENSDRDIHLVLFKKGTIIEGAEEQQKEVDEQGNGLPF